MSLIKCPECGKEISDKASYCLNCGCPLNNKENEDRVQVNQQKVKKVIDKKLITSYVVIIVIMSFLFANNITSLPREKVVKKAVCEEILELGFMPDDMKIKVNEVSKDSYFDYVYSVKIYYDSFDELSDEEKLLFNARLNIFSYKINKKLIVDIYCGNDLYNQEDTGSAYLFKNGKLLNTFN